MGLETLSDDVFRRGCGVTRSFALRGPRYRQLLKQVPHVPNATGEEVAETMLLGEMLADRAFLNLPKHIRDEAVKWNRLGVSRQFRVIDEILQLRSTSWFGSRKNRPNNSTENEALPHARGSWTRGNTQPNCLGLAQMLIGFARATKAPHLLIDTLVSRDHSTEEYAYRTLAKAVDLLSGADSDASFVQAELKQAKIALRRSLELLADMQMNYQAHHALLMKTRLGWLVIDPYMHRYYPLAMSVREERSILSMIERQPNMHAVKRVAASTANLKLELYTAVMRRAVKLLAYIDDETKEVPLADCFKDAMVCVVALNIFPDKDPSEAVFADAMERVRRFCLLPVRSVNNTHADISDERLEWFGQTAFRRRLALKRLFHMHFVAVAQHMVRDLKDQTAPHPLIAIAHPTYHLATMTLNHVAHQTSRSSGELIRFGGSQWLVHDTLKEVVDGDNPRLKRIMLTKLARLGRIDEAFVLPALKPFVLRKE